MRILLSYIHYPVSAAKYFKSALKDMGHEVVSAGPFAMGNLPWVPGLDFSAFADMPDIKLEPNYPLESVLEKSGKVDLVIQMDANFFLKGRSPVPNVVYAIDNHVATYDETEFDIFFGAHSWGAGSDRPNFRWLPCAYSPKDHFPVPGPKTKDIAFLGVIYEHRARLLNALSWRGLVGVGQGVLGEEYNKSYSQASIGLCLSAKGDLPMRVFENAAMGLCLLCDEQRDLPKLGMIEGRDYVGFTSTEQAVEKFLFLKSNPDEIMRIAHNGQEKLREHTWQARAQEIINKAVS